MGTPDVRLAKALFLATISGIALLPGIAAAQQASTGAATPQAADSGVGEIIVTAQKRSENVQNVPISISAFTADALQARGIADVTAMGNLAPNVTLDAGTPFSGSSAVLSAYSRPREWYVTGRFNF